MRDMIGSDQAMQEVTTNYFRAIHRWLPALSEVRWKRRIGQLDLQPSAEMALLLLCMHLLLEKPCQESDSTTFSQLYKSARLTFALVQMNVGPSTALAQCGLLLSVYEYGHALSHVALQTIKDCSKIAHALGWHVKSTESYLCRLAAEEKRTWWGILMLDR
jgi:hypothetical protein